MQVKEIIKEEGIRFWFGLASTALGVFIALSVNNCDGDNKDDERYKNMLTAIRAEALLNYDTLENSFMVYSVNDSIDIKNEFTFKIAEEFLKSEIFLSRTDQNDISRLARYILNLKKANTFKTADEKYKDEKKYFNKQYSNELKIFRKAFKSTLNSCDADIRLAANLNENFRKK